ncbi:MAG: Carboxypeptidase regulatory-like domain, partial [Bacteroidota bacterium]
MSAQEVKGKLFDANNKPVAFANVLLFDEKDSTLKATALSDTAGYFSLNLPNSIDWYYVSIQYFGIKPYKTKSFSGNYDLGNLNLNSSSF